MPIGGETCNVEDLVRNFASGFAGLWQRRIGLRGNRQHFGYSAGLYNGADTATGFQWGLINITESMNGFQLALFNMTKRMDGLQIGIINVISSKDSLPVLPLVNWSF